MDVFLITLLLPLVWSLRGFRSYDEVKFANLSSELKLYVEYTKPLAPFHVCNAFVSPEDTFCGDLITGYLKTTRCAKFVSDYSHWINLNDTYTSVSFLTMGSKEQFNWKLKQLVESDYFTNRGKYSFIICASVRDPHWLKRISRRIWSYRILDFAIVYPNGTLKVCTYNPFDRQLNITDIREMYPGFKQFPDKLINMHRYPFKVLTVLTRMSAVAKFSNFEYNFAKSLAKHFNLTLLQVKIGHNSSFNSYVYKRLASEDIELYPHTLTADGFDVPNEYSKKVALLNPHILDNWAVLVPNPPKMEKWKRFAQSLLVEVLPASAAVTVLVAFLNKHLTRHSKRLDLLGFVAVQFRTSLSSFIREKSFIKCSWMLWCIIYGTIVDLINLNIALVNQYEQGISTLKELRQSPLKVYSLWLPMPDIQNVNVVGIVEWMDRVVDGNEEAAFIAPNSQLELLAHWLRNRNKQFNYRTLDRCVRTGYGALVSKAKSPYLRDLENLALLVRQIERTSKLPYRRDVWMDNDKHSKVLKTEEFLGPMVVLILGLCLSCITFLIECFYC